MAKNLLDWLKSQTLDRTNLDEKVVGAVKSIPQKVDQYFNQPRQFSSAGGMAYRTGKEMVNNVMQGTEALKQRQESINQRTQGMSFLDRLKSPATQQENQQLWQGAKTAGYSLLPQNVPFTVASMAFSGAPTAMSGRDPSKAMADTAMTAPIAGKFIKVTNPLISKQLQRFNAPAMIKNKISPMVANIAQGIGIDVATGQKTTPLSVGIDALTGQSQFGDAVNVKGFDVGRTSKTKWTKEDKNLFEGLNDYLRSNYKKLSDTEIDQIDKKISTLADGYLSNQTIKNIAAKHQSNTKGFLNEITSELQKSIKGQEDAGFIKIGFAGEKVPKVETSSLTKDVSTGKKVFNDILIKNKSVLEKAGPVGKQTANLITDVENTGSRMAGDVSFRLKQAIDKIPKADKQNFADFVEGKAVPTDPNTAKAVQLWKVIADDVLKRSQDAGLSVGKTESYFPHIVPDSALTPKGKLSFLQKMVDSGIAKDVGEADKILASTRRTSPRKYGNLEKSRTVNFPEYKKDSNVLFDYISDSYRRIAEAKGYGPNDEKLYKMATDMAGGNANNEAYFKRTIDQMLGKDSVDSTARTVSSAIRKVQTVRKLSPTTSIKNLTQSISTAFRTDIPTTLKAIKNVMMDPDRAKEIAIRTGQLDDSAIKTGMETWGEGNTASKWIKMIGMQGTEKFNRTVATNAGYDFTEKLAKQALKGSESAIRELKRLGFSDAQISKGLKESDFLDAALKISKQTQFSTTPSELPYGWNTPAGKVLTQFKSFAYKQTELLGTQAKRIVEEGTKGNFKPFLNTLVLVGVAAPVVGEINATLSSVFKNKKREESGVKRYFANISNAISLGLFDDLESLSGKYGPSGQVSALLGPTVGDAYKLGVQGPTSYEPGKFYGREALKSIPGIGQTLSNSLIPNAAVTNVWGGKNVGLPEDQAKIMKSMPKEQGATYKIQQQQLQSNEDAQKPGIFAKIMDKLVPDAGASNGKYDVSTPALKKQAVSFINKKIEAGSPLTPEEAGIVFTGEYEAMPSKTAYEARKKEETGYKNASKIYDNESLAPEQKTQLYKKLGTSEEEVDYAKKASDNDTDQTLYIQDQLASMTPEERDSYLLRGRSIVNNGMLISDAVLTKLVASGEISKSESKALKTVSFVKDNSYTGEDSIKIGDNTYKPVKKTGSGSGSGNGAKGFGTDSMVKIKLPTTVGKSSSASKGSLKLTAPTSKKLTISKPNLQKKSIRRKVKLKY